MHISNNELNDVGVLTWKYIPSLFISATLTPYRIEFYSDGYEFLSATGAGDEGDTITATMSRNGVRLTYFQTDC